MDHILTQGVQIPRLGFGTFRMPGNDCRAVVESALDLGYRHIDTAAMYENEKAVGDAISASAIKRSDLFVTTKVWHDQLSPHGIRHAFGQSLARLGLDYVDMYMVHWPAVGMDMAAVLKTLRELKDEGRTRSIGVCNFNLPMLRHAIEVLEAQIAAVQVEYHPFLDQSALLHYLRAHNIPLTAYAPLAQGRVAEDPVLQGIGKEHGVSAAQVAIAWLLEQSGVIAIPKAKRESSQKDNLAASSVRLTQADRNAIAALPKALRYVQPPFAPAWDATEL